MIKQSTLYSLSGFLLGIGAPASWVVIRLLLFYDNRQTFFGQITGDILLNREHVVMYLFMGLGTASVLATLGFLIGRNGDELRQRSAELDLLNSEVASQKELFENRYLVLDNNIKNFHQISSKIQMSLNLEEILLLCGEGLHDILGYERVNILMSNNGTQARFVTAIGTNHFDINGVTQPLDPSVGVIYKCFSEKKVFLIDDISKYR